ncbi:MAG: transposase [Acidobacteria bacterium]|nr:transposase [Acidobacteriota bacterium]
MDAAEGLGAHLDISSDIHAIEHALSDNGREYCGRPLSQPYELYLAINQIEHRRTDIGSPQTNGFCERFHRTAKEEFFSVAFRKTFFESLAQQQADLDRYMAFYNQERAHQATGPGAARPIRRSSTALPR